MAKHIAKTSSTPMQPLRTHDLASFSQFQNYHERLQSLGLETLEALTGAAQVARPELEAYLGTSIDGLLAQIPAAATAIPQSALQIIQNADYPLGVDLDHIPRPSTAPPVIFAAAATLPASVNLVSQMPSIRNQGQRGTCVAFSALAAYEHSLSTSGAGQDLSEQFLYWNCKRSDGYPNQEGTWLGVAYPLLQRDGCCPEGVWAYVPTPVVGNEG